MSARPPIGEAGAPREGTLSLGGPGLVGGRANREWTPDDLQIAGLVPMSTVDWPGKFAASLFLQGCPWACPYCHNSAIIDPRIPGVVAWSALEDLLGAGLVDWVGIDVKATRGNYEAVVGRAGAGERAWESLGIVLAHPEVDHEVRLTVYPDGPGDGFEVAARAREMGARTFALQQARDMGTPDGFSATRPGWDDQVRSLARDIETLDFERFIFRGDS